MPPTPPPVAADQKHEEEELVATLEAYEIIEDANVSEAAGEDLLNTIGLAEEVRILYTPRAELERDVGLSACNQQVIGLLREALTAQGKAALERLRLTQSELRAARRSVAGVLARVLMAFGPAERGCCIICNTDLPGVGLPCLPMWPQCRSTSCEKK